jgi:hypothetical protein
MSETEIRRKSPETRRTPLGQLVFDEPVPLPDAYAERFQTSRPKEQGAGRLAGRETPLAGGMGERVPSDGSWYLAAICYSQGQATSLASHISRGGYGRNVQVAHGLIPNANKRGMGREHAVLLKRKRGK